MVDGSSEFLVIRGVAAPLDSRGWCSPVRDKDGRDGTGRSNESHQHGRLMADCKLLPTTLSLVHTVKGHIVILLRKTDQS